MEDYQEYFVARKPSDTGMKVIYFWHAQMLKIAKRYIPDLQHKTILEIGSGHGFIAECCKHNNIEYLGHELNNAQANELQHLGYDVTQARIPPIPAGKATQVIWLSHVLEHAVNYAEAKAMLDACYQRLDDKGYVVIIAPDILHWKNFFWSCDWSHGFPTTLNRVSQLLSETGFNVVTANHHTACITQPFLAWLISRVFGLFPTDFMDYFSEKITGRRLFHAFMSMFGYRQILLIGTKP